MPQRIRCTSCWTVLYSGLELESPTETIERYNGCCPKCSKKLVFDSESIKIVPFEQSLK